MTVNDKITQDLDVEAEEKALIEKVDTLDLDDDEALGGFLSGDISENVKQLLLKKIFAHPVFNQRDGLDDYDEDFTLMKPLINNVVDAVKSISDVNVDSVIDIDETSLDSKEDVDRTNENDTGDQED